MKEKISVYVFVLKNVFGNIKFVRMETTEQGIVEKGKLSTTELSNHLFLLASLILIAIKLVLGSQVIGKCVYETRLSTSHAQACCRLSAIYCKCFTAQSSRLKVFNFID